MLSIELYTQLIQENSRLKGKEESVEDRIELARDAGYYQGRTSLFEEMLEKEGEEPAQIDILDPEAELRKYKENLIEKIENEINRLKNILQKNKGEMNIEQYYTNTGYIEGLETAIKII